MWVDVGVKVSVQIRRFPLVGGSNREILVPNATSLTRDGNSHSIKPSSAKP